MYFNDHNPPHFHAKYGDYKAIFDIENGVVSGKFPKRALNLVSEWLKLHKYELMENWHRAQSGIPLIYIKPLE